MSFPVCTSLDPILAAQAGYWLSQSNGYFPQQNILDFDCDDADQEKRHSTRLLVVDDDDVDRERISRYLKKFKMPVVILDASNGSEAIKHAAEENIDLILLDYQLGDMTGTDVLKKIYTQSRKTTIPTIMITGMGDEETAIEAIRLGVHDYLPKNSLTAESLITVIESALHTAKLEERLKASQAQMRRLSMYDALTGLANRNLFFDRLNQATFLASRNHSTFCTMMIDLNLFKEINDGVGHMAGDQVLHVIGERLQSLARKSDTIARLGGDEFVCILHDVAGDKEAILVAEKIINCISEPIAIGDRILQVGASIGIARFPEHGEEPSTLLSNADAAMYRAKKTNHRHHIFNDTDNQQGGKTIAVTQHLYRAIQKNELCLEYQPKIDVRTQRLIGVEALARWDSPVFGRIMPGDFIPTAERSSLIEDITYAIMDVAFRDIHKWQKMGLNFPVAINISARMLDDAGFLNKVLNKLKRYNITEENVLFEITETTLASSGTHARTLLKNILNAGIKVSIDDFGSGFTSYSSIRNIPISELKIDQVFVKHLSPGGRDAAIVHSINLLAENLGIRAVVEGVETDDQLQILQELGCKYMQGYGIAHPMPVHELTTWIEAFGQDITLD